MFCCKTQGVAMHWFYVKNSQIKEGKIKITGQDVTHIRQVLRMKAGERVVICDGEGTDYYCTLEELGEREVTAKIEQMNASESELPMEIYLFQGLPKADKMEFIIQKAVELGVHAVIPVATKRSVVRLDEKKAEKKRERWQGISEAAAKQSGRGIIPKVFQPVSFSEALFMAEEMEIRIIPYEQAEGMALTRKIFDEISRDAAKGHHKKIALLIGPEGGFEETEILQAEEKGVTPISLGKRILRTETAPLVVLSALMLSMECSS